MALFATASELADRLGVSLSESEESRAKGLLELASSLIQQEAGQEIEQVEDDELTRRGTESARILLPERPVKSVSKVVLDGEEIEEEDEWYVEGDELVREVGGWGQPDEVLVITYTHGYEAVPDIAKVICLEAVVRAWINPGSVLSEEYGSERVAYSQGTPRGLLLSEIERRDIRQAFRRGAGSVTLR